MAVGPIKGLHKVTARVADGSRRTYWYAWKGGPRLEGEPGTPAFEASYRRAIRRRNQARHGDTLAGLAAAYRASPEFENRSASTLREWSRHLDMIQADDGPLAIASLPVTGLGDPRVRQHLLAWRDQWRATPRKADYAMQVLSAVLSWAVDRGTLAVNVLIGHKGLYASDRADQIWSDEEIARFVEAAPSPEVGYIVRLACLTGLRRGDLVRLEWDHVGDIAIVIEPNKSRRRRPGKAVTIPLPGRDAGTPGRDQGPAGQPLGGPGRARDGEVAPAAAPAPHRVVDDPRTAVVRQWCRASGDRRQASR